MSRTWILHWALILTLGACDDASPDTSDGGAADASASTADASPSAADASEADASEGGAELSCAWEREQLVPPATPQLPTDREGALEDVLIGSWQHTFIVYSNDNIEANGEGTDLRYVFGPEKMAFCQHVEGVYGPDENVAEYTLDGDVINVGTTYTAVAWSADTLVLNNDAMGDQQYVLQRR